MKLWIDDIRDAPDNTWIVARSLPDAMDLLKVFRMAECTPFVVSFDHDLGGPDTTRPIVRWMAEHDWWPLACRVHSANPVGHQWLTEMITRYGPGVTR